MNTSALKTFAPAVRNQLMEAVTRKLDFVLTAQTPDYLTTFAPQVAALRDLAKANRGGLIERVAYTWFNRLAALRFMDARGWHPFRARVLTPASAEETQPELLKVTRTGALPEELKSHTDPQRLNDLLDGRIPSPNAQGEVYRHIVLAACRFYHALLPNLFEKLDDETELLLPDDLLTEHSVVQGFRTEISDEDCGDGQRANVEILGWLYQFYISERKDQVMARKSAVPTEDIPAVTQLFTPHWIVRYLVENSLGRLWLLNRPNSRLREHMPYYIEDAAQVSGNDRPHPGPLPQEREKHSPPSANTDAPGVSPVLAAKTKAATTTATAELFHDALSRSLSPGERAGVRASVENDFLKITKPEEIRLCDPAVGSAHTLSYAFDLLFLIYEEEGYAPTEIPALILRHNLHGLEICPRAAQLAELALVFKAREKSRRFFQPEHLVRPHIIELRDVKFEDGELAEYFKAIGINPSTFIPHTSSFPKLLRQFEEAKNFGSLIQPCLSETEIQSARSAIHNSSFILHNSSGQLFLRETHLKVLRVLEQAEALTQRYHVVVANPPYMGSKFYNGRMKVFVEELYLDSKADLYGCFMQRCLSLVMEKGLAGMITIPNWMFLSSFEPLRRILLTKKRISSLVHIGRGVWGSDFGSCAFVLGNNHSDTQRGVYKRLFLRQGEVFSNEELEQNFFNVRTFPDYFASAREMRMIAGYPIAYWVTPTVREIFTRAIPLEETASPRQGLATGENSRFVRSWHEVAHQRIGFNFGSRKEASDSHLKWFPYNKGGEFRRWFGNCELVINWESDGCDLWANRPKTVIRNPDFYFRQGVTWSFVSAAYFGVRYSDKGFIFDVGGSSAFPNEADVLAVTGFMCSELASRFMQLLNPTLNFQVGNVAKLPWLPDEVGSRRESIDKVVTAAISIARADWDNFETSWDFRDQPLLRPGLKGATLGFFRDFRGDFH